MGRFRAPADPGLRIAVSGEEFWFRVRYERPGREPVESGIETPRLDETALVARGAGHYAGYLSRQLRLWAEGTRGGTAHAPLMHGVGHVLEPDDIAAVAAHYARERDR